MGNIVAIDGGAYTGTSSLAKSLAEVFDLSNLNTGSMYRAVTAVVLELGLDPYDALVCEDVAQSLVFGYKDGAVYSAIDTSAHQYYDVTNLIGGELVTKAVSPVSAHPEVRSILVDRQREIAVSTAKDYAIEGRDIGTVVAPAAQLKLYLTATEQSRAKRSEDSGRYGSLENNRERDKIDSERADSPLRPAHDAVILDTTNLTQAETLAVAVAIMDLRGFIRRTT